MKRLKRLRPTPALIIAMIALFVALGGGATAGTVLLITGKQVKNSSLTGADIKNNTLTSKDVKNLKSQDIKDGSLQAKDFAAGQLPAGATGPAGPAGATGPAGAAGPAGPAGTALAFARVLGNGTGVDEANSKGIVDANVSHPVTGLYCFDLPFTPMSSIATVDWIGGGATTVIHAATSATASCPAGTEATARTVDSAGAAVDITAFYILFN